MFIFLLIDEILYTIIEPVALYHKLVHINSRDNQVCPNSTYFCCLLVGSYGSRCTGLFDPIRMPLARQVGIRHSSGPTHS